MDSHFIYNKYSEHLLKKYGEKVYKLPINLNISCPNRDGNIGVGGCIFCGEEGAGFETLSDSFSVCEQLEKNRDFIRKKYKAEKFIAYFQNYSNTYMPIMKFASFLEEAAGVEGVVEIAISTRPDCISKEYLDICVEIQKCFNVNITFELGLQSVNYHSLIKVNRGHTLAEFIDATLSIHEYGFEVCAHVILNLPWDTQEDIIETAKFLSALRVEQVKLHALFIVKNTLMAKMYEKDEIKIIDVQEYEQRVIDFLEYLSPQIVVQRLIGRAPQENTLFVNWGMSWWRIRDEIEKKMLENNLFQGRRFNYLGGSALKTFGKEH